MTIENILKNLQESKKNNTPFIEIEVVDMPIYGDPNNRVEVLLTVFGEETTYILRGGDTIAYNFDAPEEEEEMGFTGKTVTAEILNDKKAESERQLADTIIKFHKEGYRLDSFKPIEREGCFGYSIIFKKN